MSDFVVYFYIYACTHYTATDIGYIISYEYNLFDCFVSGRSNITYDSFTDSSSYLMPLFTHFYGRNISHFICIDVNIC